MCGIVSSYDGFGDDRCLLPGARILLMTFSPSFTVYDDQTIDGAPCSESSCRVEEIRLCEIHGFLLGPIDRRTRTFRSLLIDELTFQDCFPRELQGGSGLVEGMSERTAVYS